MSPLGNITYSRSECINAFEDFYLFLAKLYLDETLIEHPPAGGWTNITTESLKELCKSDEVIELLRHLPYISPLDDVYDAHAAADSSFANWEQIGADLASGVQTAESIKICTEGPEICENIGPHVFGLTLGGRGTAAFLLDTQLGIVHWYDCDDQIENSATPPQVFYDASLHGLANEETWRENCCAWSISDFFVVLKEQFRKLHYIPISRTKVIDCWIEGHNEEKDMIPELHRIYRQHGWPNMRRYRKDECMEAVQKLMKEKYDDYAECY